MNECALSFEEMCRYRYLVNVGSNGYANKMKYLFLCGSVVITVREGMNNREFFERQGLVILARHVVCHRMPRGSGREPGASLYTRKRTSLSLSYPI